MYHYFQQLGILDLLLFIALVIGSAFGARSGIVAQLSSMIIITLSIFFYSQIYSVIQKYIDHWVENKQMLPYLVATIFIAGTSILSIFIGKIIRFFIRTTPMGILDRGIGAIVGGVKWLFFSSFIIWMVGNANSKIKEKYISKSISKNIMDKVMPKIFNRISNMPARGKSLLRKQMPKTVQKKRNKVNPDLDF